MVTHRLGAKLIFLCSLCTFTNLLRWQGVHSLQCCVETKVDRLCHVECFVFSVLIHSALSLMIAKNDNSVFPCSISLSFKSG